MDGGIVRGLVGNSDNYSIALLGINNRSRGHVIDGNNFLGVAQFFNSHGMKLKQ